MNTFASLGSLRMTGKLLLLSSLLLVQSTTPLSITDQQNGWPKLIDKYKTELSHKQLYRFEHFSILCELETHLKTNDLKTTQSILEIVYVYDNLCKIFQLLENNDSVIKMVTVISMKNQLLEKISKEKADQIKGIISLIKLDNTLNILDKTVKIAALVTASVLIYKNRDFLREKFNSLINNIYELKLPEKASQLTLEDTLSKLKTGTSSLVAKSAEKLTDLVQINQNFTTL